jgi:hypothetical protein
MKTTVSGILAFNVVFVLYLLVSRVSGFHEAAIDMTIVPLIGLGALTVPARSKLPVSRRIGSALLVLLGVILTVIPVGLLVLVFVLGMPIKM